MVVHGNEFVMGRSWREVHGVFYIAAASHISVPTGKTRYERLILLMFRARANCIAGRLQEMSPSRTTIDFIVSIDIPINGVPKNVLAKLRDNSSDCQRSDMVDDPR